MTVSTTSSIHDFASLLMDRVTAEATKLSIATGVGSGVDSFENYKLLVGRAKGLLRAVDMIEETLADYQRGDE